MHYCVGLRGVAVERGTANPSGVASTATGLFGDTDSSGTAFGFMIVTPSAVALFGVDDEPDDCPDAAFSCDDPADDMLPVDTLAAERPVVDGVTVGIAADRTGGSSSRRTVGWTVVTA